MTSLIVLERPAPDVAERSATLATVPGHRAPGRASRRLRWLRRPSLWLTLILAVQGVAAYSTTGVSTAFEDEGLYIFMGHRMIAHLLHHVFLQEYPGSYFSGAPGLYPVLAALADDVGGLGAVRAMSLGFALIATIGVYGLSRQLFGKLAGLLAAAVFATFGSTLFQAQWATYDSMAMALMALGAWLAVYSARRDGLLWAPAIAIILCVAVLTKYAVAVYVPCIAALVVADQLAARGWRIVWRSAAMLASWAIIAYFVLMLWGRSLLQGIEQTTASRNVLEPTPKHVLLSDIAHWAGPWLALVAVGAIVVAVTDRKRILMVVVLTGASVVGAVEQVRMGELTSLSKHLAFGMVFGAPLVGLLLAKLAKVRWGLGVLPVAAALVGLTLHGVTLASGFRTIYPSDAGLQVVLRQAIANNPGKPILGEQPSPQRYELSDITTAREWADTYEFSFAGKSGPAAYQQAIKDHYFGVIYLSFSTKNATPILNSLGKAQGPDHYYNLVAKIPRILHGNRIGDWLVWAPQTTQLSPTH